MYYFEPIEEKHLEEIAGILNFYVVNTTVTFHKKLLRADDMREKVFFDKPYYKSFLIREKGCEEIIGYCAYTQWKIQEAYRHTAEINVFLRPQFTGHGIGSVAISFLEKNASENKINNLIAGVCIENIPSLKLLHKNGYMQCAHFQQVGEKFGRILDVVYLQKILK